MSKGAGELFGRVQGDGLNWHKVDETLSWSSRISVACYCSKCGRYWGLASDALYSLVDKLGIKSPEDPRNAVIVFAGCSDSKCGFSLEKPKIVNRT